MFCSIYVSTCLISGNVSSVTNNFPVVLFLFCSEFPRCLESPIKGVTRTSNGTLNYCIYTAIFIRLLFSVFNVWAHVCMVWATRQRGLHRPILNLLAVLPGSVLSILFQEIWEVIFCRTKKLQCDTQNQVTFEASWPIASLFNFYIRPVERA